MEIIFPHSLPQAAHDALENQEDPTDWDVLVLYKSGDKFFCANHDEYAVWEWTGTEWSELAWEHWLALRAGTTY